MLFFDQTKFLLSSTSLHWLNLKVFFKPILGWIVLPNQKVCVLHNRKSHGIISDSRQWIWSLSQDSIASKNHLHRLDCLRSYHFKGYDDWQHLSPVQAPGCLESQRNQFLDEQKIRLSIFWFSLFTNTSHIHFTIPADQADSIDFSRTPLSHKFWLTSLLQKHCCHR